MDFRDHVSDLLPNKGQNYDYIEYWETNPPSPMPPLVGNLANFYDIITNSDDDLGILLITSHGNTENISVEAYEYTASGMSAALGQLSNYKNGLVVPGVCFTDQEIFFTWTKYTYVICAHSNLIENKGELNQSLVYVGSCQGWTLTDNFVNKNARVAVGNDTSFVDAQMQKTRISTFFSRMNGYGLNRQLDRPVSAAMDGLPLWGNGAFNTTLSPSVLSVESQCPMAVGDSVVFIMDTKCREVFIPDIKGSLCQIENEYWYDSITLVGFCTATPPSIANAFSLKLQWGEICSGDNAAFLDGNMNPMILYYENAMGPSEDDFIVAYATESDQVFRYNSTSYRPYINPIGVDWLELQPNPQDEWEISDWKDNNDLILSSLDTIEIINQFDQTIRNELIDIVTPILIFSKYTDPGNPLYMELITDNPEINNITHPEGLYCAEISPTYTRIYMISSWTNNSGTGYLSINDYIDLRPLSGPDSGQNYSGDVIDFETLIVTSPIPCQGLCGDANGDGIVTVSDAVIVYNYVFIGGPAPLPVMSCGDANGDEAVNVSDAVWIINYVFVGGGPPGDCSPGNWASQGGDCCPFE